MKLYSLCMLILLGCNSNVEPELINEDVKAVERHVEFDFSTDFFVECIEMESFFSYLETRVNTPTLYVDFDIVPDNWICVDGLEYLIEASQMSNPCGKLKSNLLYTGDLPTHSTFQSEATWLLRWYLFGKNITETSAWKLSKDDVIMHTNAYVDTMTTIQ